MLGVARGRSGSLGTARGRSGPPGPLGAAVTRLKSGKKTKILTKNGNYIAKKGSYIA